MEHFTYLVVLSWPNVFNSDCVTIDFVETTSFINMIKGGLNIQSKGVCIGNKDSPLFTKETLLVYTFSFLSLKHSLNIGK